MVRHLGTRLGLCLLIASPQILTSCSSTSSPTNAASRHFGDSRTELEVQSIAMQMADDYSAALGETVYLMLDRAALEPTARWLALSFLRNGMGAALDIAAGPNPDVAVLDLLVLGSLQSWAFREHWLPKGIQPARAARAIARMRAAEDSLWVVAREVVNDEQEARLRSLIGTWIAEHPNQTVVAFVRFSDFTEERHLSTVVARGEAAGLLAEVGEATAAVDDARLFGERAMWFASRYPYLLGQQAELTAYRMADQPEMRDVRATLRATERLARSAADRLENLDAERDRWLAAAETSVQKLMADGAQHVERAREAAVDHFFDRVRTERDALLSETERLQNEIESTLTSAQATAVEATAAGNALTATATALDRVLERFDRDPARGRPPLQLDDLRDTAAAARDAGVELTALLERFDGMAGPDGRLDVTLRSAADLGATIGDGLLWRGAVLIGLLLFGLLVLRRVPRR